MCRHSGTQGQCLFDLSIDFAECASDVNICLCAGFVRGSHFTQWKLFSASGISMLNVAFASAGDNGIRSFSDPLEEAHLRFLADTVADLKRCRDDLLLRRNTSRNTRKREFGLTSVESSTVDDPMSRIVVRISIIVEVGEVQFRPTEPYDPFPPESGCSSPGKGKKRARVSSPLVAKKKVSLVDSPPVSRRKRVSLEEGHSFVAALDRSFEVTGTQKSGRDCRAAPIFQLSRH